MVGIVWHHNIWNCFGCQYMQNFNFFKPYATFSTSLAFHRVISLAMGHIVLFNVWCILKWFYQVKLNQVKSLSILTKAHCLNQEVLLTIKQYLCIYIYYNCIILYIYYNCIIPQLDNLSILFYSILWACCSSGIFICWGLNLFSAAYF